MKNFDKKNGLIFFGKLLKQMKPFIYSSCFIALLIGFFFILNMNNSDYTVLFSIYRIAIKAIFAVIFLYCVGLIIQLFFQFIHKENKS